MEASQARLLARARSRQVADLERQLAQLRGDSEAAAATAAQQQQLGSQALADTLIALAAAQKVNPAPVHGYRRQ
jgi:hypothetical protein